MLENGNEKIRKVLFTETRIIVSVIIATIAILGFFFKIQMDVAAISTDIQVIKENHMATSERAIKEIDILKQKDTGQDKITNDILIKIERILTLMEK